MGEGDGVLCCLGMHTRSHEPQAVRGTIGEQRTFHFLTGGGTLGCLGGDEVGGGLASSPGGHSGGGEGTSSSVRSAWVGLAVGLRAVGVGVGGGDEGTSETNALAFVSLIPSLRVWLGEDEGWGSGATLASFS